jgi:hypothetical protein
MKNSTRSFFVFLIAQACFYFLFLGLWWVQCRGQVPILHYLTIRFPISVMMTGTFIALSSGYWVLLPFVFGIAMRLRLLYQLIIVALFPLALATFWLGLKADGVVPSSNPAYPAFGFAICAAAGAIIGNIVANWVVRRGQVTANEQIK